jgi:8-oxo-dGTP diphosphatase
MSSTLLLPSLLDQQDYDEVTYTETVEGREVHFRLLGNVSSIPPSNKITSAAIIPFLQQDKIVTAVLERGLDIPGGHTEAGDEGVVHTIKRETYEEVCVSLADPLYLIGIISSDYKGSSLDQITYMLIATGQVNTIDNFEAKFESTSREIVSTDAFIDRYKAGSQEMMKEIIKRAKGLSDTLFSS